MRTRPTSTLRRGFVLALTAMVGLLPDGAARATDDDPPIDFNRQVRPILSDKCFACHGPDEAVREADLRLDLAEAALLPADSGKPAIVPGKPDSSPLIKRVFSRSKGLVMPPPETGKTLSSAEKDVLRAWIAQGAKFQTHWSFQAPRRPDLPAVKDATWVRNPVDRFILARLEAAGLEPAPEAGRATLVRRLSLDLTGLPPTLAEVDAFLADTRPDAYERLVDRLLASPHYGERMALDWLDAARYADTHGYHIDSGRDMTRWREWVIDAFNTNLPFDRFTVEQLAGDLMPGATLSQKIASGFNRNHMITFEGGVIPEEYLTAYVVDRVNTTATVWLGLTVSCAQCHDHKYDPLTQKDFYQLYAFFNGVPENGVDGSKGNAAPMIKAPSNEQQAALDRIDATRAEALQALDRLATSDSVAERQWESSLAARPAVVWRPLTPATLEARGQGRLVHKGDGVVEATGPNPPTEVYQVSAPAPGEGLSGLRLELLPDPALAGGGPGRSVNGNIVLTDVRIDVTAEGKGPRRLAIRTAAADFSQKDFPASNAVDADPGSGWAIDPEEGKPHRLDLILAEPLPSGAGGTLRVALEFGSRFASHQPGRFRLSTTAAPDPLRGDDLPAELAAALKVEPARRTEAQRAAVGRYYLTHVDPEGMRLRSRIDGLTRERAALEAQVPTAMVMGTMERPRDTFLLLRGQYDKKGEKVAADVPACLPPLPSGASHDRLALARWLVDGKNPLVARVAVNRVWQRVFGTGIVRTSEDFGSQGELPSHPALLDWLAVDWTAPGPGRTPWDIKALVRLLVTSATYRQSSAVTPAALAHDPEDRLLARAPRVRLAAELVRDQALAVSGLLNPEIGGQSVSPYQPAGLWEELMSRADGKNWSAQVYEQSHGKDLYRRSMYTFWKRTSPPPSLATFDAPDRETCTVRRVSTNTPLQALVLMNDPTYVEASRKLAARMIRDGGTGPETRIALAFRLCAARLPTAEESTVLRGVHDANLARFRADTRAANELLSVGESARDRDLDPAEHAAWTTVASVILNLDEVVNKN